MPLFTIFIQVFNPYIGSKNNKKKVENKLPFSNTLGLKYLNIKYIRLRFL